MPFNFADMVNSASRSALGSPMIRAVMGNPIYTGVAVAVIMMLVTAFVYRDVDAGFAPAARVAVWSFFILMSTFALHRMVIREEMRNDARADQSAQIFGGTDITSLMRQDIVPVTVGVDRHTSGVDQFAEDNKIEY